MNVVFDALGNPVVLGNWYGYSRSDSGWAHTTIGKVIKITPPSQYSPGKVRLGSCIVKRFLYGQPTDYREDEKPSDVTIASHMVFSVPDQDRVV